MAYTSDALKKEYKRETDTQREKNLRKIREDIAKLTSYSTRTIKDKYLNKMLQAEVVIMTIPDKPTSSKQKYKLKTE